MSKIVGSERVKRGMAEMQKGGVIMDVVNAEQARIAEEAGAVAVMALERVPSDIRAAGGVARSANPKIVEEVMNAVSIPVMAKARIGHITEARVLEAMGVDYIDESEVLTKDQIQEMIRLAKAKSGLNSYLNKHPDIKRYGFIDETLSSASFKAY